MKKNIVTTFLLAFLISSTFSQIKHIPKTEENFSYIIKQVPGDTVAVERVFLEKNGFRSFLSLNRLATSEIIYNKISNNRSKLEVITSTYEEKGKPLQIEVTSDSLKAANNTDVKFAQNPFIERSWALLGEVIRQAKKSNEKRVKVFNPFFQSTENLDVEFLSKDSVHVTAGNQRYYLKLNSEGFIQKGILPDYNIIATMVLDLPKAAYSIAPLHGAPENAPYTAEEVRIDSPEGHTLAGTLTLPKNYSQPMPAIVLITGAGKLTRNSGSGATSTFWQLAHHLSSNGIAVLRLDDRGVGESTGNWENNTLQGEAKDIEAGLAYLKKRKDINGKKLGLLGLSEGGLIAPMIAARDSSIAGVILMAGPGEPMKSVWEYQVNYAYSHVPGITKSQVDSLTTKHLAALEDPKLPLKLRSLIEYNDAIPTAQKVTAPILILHGSSDRHVPPTGAANLAKALTEGGNNDVTLHVFPSLSHVFVYDPQGLASGWGKLPSFTIPSEVLNTLSRWTKSKLIDIQ